MCNVSDGVNRSSHFIEAIAKHHSSIVGVRLICGSAAKITHLTAVLARVRFVVFGGQAKFIFGGLVSGPSGCIRECCPAMHPLHPPYRPQPPLFRKRPSPGWPQCLPLIKSLSLGRCGSTVRVCSFIDKCQIHQLRSSVASMPISTSEHDIPAHLRDHR